MLYQNGKPVHKSEQEVKQWMSTVGLTDKDLLDPKFKKIPERENAVAVYLTSSGLGKVQKKYSKEQQAVTGYSEPKKEGESVLIDFTPSRGTDVETTKPINSTIEKLKKANAQGSKTAVVTARSAEGEVTDIQGKKLTATNAQDMAKFLAAKGAKPTAGVYGVSGQNKGEKIDALFFKGKTPEQRPKEVHFYDDLPKNTKEVGDYVKNAEDVPAELFIYGPGEFAHNEADPNKPNEKIPAKKPKVTQEQIRRLVKEELNKFLKEGK